MEEFTAFSGTAKITATTEIGQEASILVNYSALSFPWYVWLGMSPFLLIFGLFAIVLTIVALPFTFIIGLFK